MKILLLGEYSNVHNTLAEGLRALGHQVTVASDGDSWKNYPRDINLERRKGKIGGISLVAKLYSLLPSWRGYDVVQLINPIFVELKAERLFAIYHYLRQHNKCVILGAYGMDYYWVHTCSHEKPLRYSDFNIGDKVRTDADAIKEQRDWLGTPKGVLNQLIAVDCDAVITALYEYHVCYQPKFPTKTHFIPLPIKMPESTDIHIQDDGKLRFFIGISKNRSEYKGTDIMLKAAQNIQTKYPDRVKLNIAEGVPFAQYQQLLNGSDAILDQLYSYTPAMNALLAMSKGIINIGGGEPESYELLKETQLHPIINVQPTYESVYDALEQLVLHPECIDKLKQQSMEYVRRHHDYLKVAKEYVNIYNKVLTRRDYLLQH